MERPQPATASSSKHRRTITGPAKVTGKELKSLNDKMSHIEDMLRRIQQDDEDDNSQLAQLIEKSEKLQEKAHLHIEKCGSMKSLLVTPRNIDVPRPAAPSPEKQHRKLSDDGQRTLTRVHSLEKYESFSLLPPPVRYQKVNAQQNKKQTRLNFLNKYIDVALEELDTSRMTQSVNVGSRYSTEQTLATEESEPEQPTTSKLEHRKQLVLPRLPNSPRPPSKPTESPFKMLMGVFTSFALLISML